MDAVRVGRALRVLRHHLALRQADVAERARVTRVKVIRIEAGRAGEVPFREIAAVFAVVGALAELQIRWHGEQLDRLLDHAHAALADKVVQLLEAAGWQCHLEVSFNRYGERGSIDILAWHAGARVLLVIELKSVVPDLQATLFSLDRKTRLARRIANERGWDPISIGRLLVIADGRTTRRRLAAHAAVIGATFPVRGRAVTTWLRSPGRDAISGLLLVRGDPATAVRRRIVSKRRVKAVSPARQ